MDTFCKLFEKILLTKARRDVNERWLLRDEQFEFRPEHSTTLQLARLVQELNTNFDDRRLTGAVFLDVAKAFDPVGVKGLLYKLTVRNFTSYLAKSVSSYLDFHSATSTRLFMRAGMVQGGSSPCTLQSVCTRHTHTVPPRRVSAVRGRYGSYSHVCCLLPDWSTGFGSGGLPSTCRIPPQLSLVRLWGASRIWDQFNF
jgi:hypothetical protein